MGALTGTISNFFAILVTLPFIAFILLYLGFILYFQERKKAMRWSMDITTAFLILSVSVMINSQFSTHAGIWTIMLTLLILGGLIGGLQNQLRGSIDIPKIFRAIWRLAFLLLSFSYILLFFLGIGKNI